MQSLAWTDPKKAFSEVRVHTTTIQVDFEVDHHGQPPANSPPGDHLITTVKETEKNSFEDIKKKLTLFVSVNDLIMTKTLSTARSPVAVSIGKCGHT